MPGTGPGDLLDRPSVESTLIRRVMSCRTSKAFPRSVWGGPAPGPGTHSAIQSSMRRPRAWPLGRRSHLFLAYPGHLGRS